MSLATGLWPDPRAWGLMLADLARHAANAYHQTEGRDRSAVLASIRAAFDAEGSVPTDSPTGSVVE